MLYTVRIDRRGAELEMQVARFHSRFQIIRTLIIRMDTRLVDAMENRIEPTIEASWFDLRFGAFVAVHSIMPMHDRSFGFGRLLDSVPSRP